MKRRTRSLLPVLDGVLLVAILLAGLVALLTLLDTVTSDHVSDLAVGVSADDLQDALPAGVSVDTAEVIADVDTGVGYRLAWWLVRSGGSLLVVAGAVVLREVVATARTGDPFVAANVRRIRLVAGLTLGHGALALLQVPVALAIQEDVGVGHKTASASGFQIVSAIVLFALAEIWQRGVDLRDEQALTV